MSTRHASPERRRVIAIADSDSYLKWAAFLMAGAPAEWDTSVIIVETAKLPSMAQRVAALAGTGRKASDVVSVSLSRIAAAVNSEHPDIVVVATLGPLADLVAERILGHTGSGVGRRPVIVSGLPGIGLPARRKALVYRAQADLFVLHSNKEVRVFSALAELKGFSHEFGLARLPFIEGQRATTASTATDLVFAAQAIVPPFRHQREQLLEWLALYATQNPSTRVVIKTRAVEGEAQTHDEACSYAELMAAASTALPPNLVLSSGPMAEHLARARALVTVSSTAAIEAVALGIPVIVLDDFGVTPRLINDVFLGSGLLASSEELLAGRFVDPDPEWLEDNYFHDQSADSWHAMAEELVQRNRRGDLLPRPRHIRGRGGALRRAWDRKRVLGSYDRSVAGAVALVIGYPARYCVLALQELAALASKVAEPQRAGAPQSQVTVPLEGEATPGRERSGSAHGAP